MRNSIIMRKHYIIGASLGYLRINRCLIDVHGGSSLADLIFLLNWFWFSTFIWFGIDL